MSYSHVSFESITISLFCATMLNMFISIFIRLMQSELSVRQLYEATMKELNDPKPEYFDFDFQIEQD